MTNDVAEPPRHDGRPRGPRLRDHRLLGRRAARPPRRRRRRLHAEPAADAQRWCSASGTDDPDTPRRRSRSSTSPRRSRARSDGTITIEPRLARRGATAPHWDQAVAHDADGRRRSTWPWSRPGRGTTSASPASARSPRPFLVTTDALTVDVLADDDLLDQLTSGLPAVGAEALGLYPEGLRHPFGFHGASARRGRLSGWRRPRGLVARTPDAMFACLGATTTDDAARHHDMIGAESSFRLTRPAWPPATWSSTRRSTCSPCGPTCATR